MVRFSISIFVVCEQEKERERGWLLRSARKKEGGETIHAAFEMPLLHLNGNKNPSWNGDDRIKIVHSFINDKLVTTVWGGWVISHEGGNFCAGRLDLDMSGFQTPPPQALWICFIVTGPCLKLWYQVSLVAEFESYLTLSQSRREGGSSFIKIYEFASRETGNWHYESAIWDWTKRCSTGRPFLAHFLSRSDCICREEIKFGPLTNGRDQIGNHRGRWISKVSSKLRSPLTGSLIRCYHFSCFSLGYHWLCDWW
jgi:hypothetical protein